MNDENKNISGDAVTGEKLSAKDLARLRAQYPEGLRVEVTPIDERPIKIYSGDRGTVDFVDDDGGVHISWDIGYEPEVVYATADERERAYATGADMWRDYAADHGITAAAKFCGKYIDRNMRSDIADNEGKFCKELFAAMFEATAGITTPDKILYPYDLPEAVNREEKPLYKASAERNADCARAIDGAIRASCYETNFYNLKFAVMSAVREYGFERVNAVLVNHIKRHAHDGRISQANRDWAREFNFSETPYTDAYLHAHAILIDDFAKYAREMYKELNAERFALPGHEEHGEFNVGYEIIRAITFNDMCGYVIGRNPEYENDYVTWQFRIRDGERVYNHGDYGNGMDGAADDYVARVAKYMQYGAREIPNPIVTVEPTISIEHAESAEPTLAENVKSIAAALNIAEGSDDARALADCLGGYEDFRLLQIRAILDSGLMAFENASAFMEWLSEDALDRFRLIDASDTASLGQYWAEEAPDDIPEDMTPEEYARECMKEEGGVFTAFGYIYRREREPSPELAALTPEPAKEKPFIRFVNSDFAEFFSIPNGANIRVTYQSGDGRGTVAYPCEYINEYHVNVGGEVYHVDEFASRMAAIGAKYEPEVQLLGAELTAFAPGSEKFFYRNDKEGNTCIGHLRGDFGKKGNGFFNNWTDRGGGERKTPEFKGEFQGVMYFLRQNALQDYNAMSEFCREHPEAKLPGDDIVNRYGFSVETETRQYFVRLTTNRDDYFYVFAYDKTDALVIEQPSAALAAQEVREVQTTHPTRAARSIKPAVEQERADGYTSVKAAIAKGKAAPKPPRKAKTLERNKSKNNEEI